jgi:outer membrane protein OmpA-like peptidoglycan-associated protein
MKKNILLSAFMLGLGFTSSAQFWDYSNPERLKGTVNQEISEEGIPILSKDLSTIYFVRTFEPANTGGEYDQDIWRSVRQGDGSYTDTKRVSGLNNKMHNAAIGMSADGNRLFLLNSYIGKKDQKKGISFASKESTGWSNPETITISDLDIDGEFSQFHVSEKEDVIVISFAGAGAIGQEDLYVSLKEGNSWSKPIHLGSTINSEGFEISPFLCPTQDTLFFSSNGLGGEGDADIFYSVKGKGWTDWSKPVNLGNRINSPKFDAHFVYHGKNAFWSSNRDGDKSDIYMIEIYTPPTLSVSCNGTDISRFSAGDGAIDAIIEGGVEPFTFKWSNGASTEDLSSLEHGEYSLTIVDAIGQMANTSCVITEPAPPENKVIRLPEVQYPLNQWKLLSDGSINSPDSLLYVYELMLEFPGLVLELSSHTDSRGSSMMNGKLSQNRSRACYKYLVEEKGIDPRRIVLVGKGESTPKTIWRKGDEYMVSEPADLTGVEKIVLTERYINQFKKSNENLFEMLHQLNRRTEGRILSMDFDPENAAPADPKFLEYVKYP